MSKKEKKATVNLDVNLCKSLRDAFNDSPIFSHLDKYHNKYNLCCAVMDRIESAVSYINNEVGFPFDKEQDLITFMAYACFIVDGVKTLYERIFHVSPYNAEKKYFLHAQQQKYMHLEEKDYVNDDKFFEYFRSITFAHPFNTDRTYKQVYGSQVSPWILTGYNAVSKLVTDISDPIGARIYAGNLPKHSDIIHVEVSFKQLIKYLTDRYSKLENVIEWFKSEKDNTIDEWKKTPAKLCDNPIDTIIDIDKTLTNRLMTHYGVKQLYYYLACDITEEANVNAINIYRSAIVARLNDLVDATNNMDEMKIDNIITDLTRAPRKVNGEMHYQLEKIYSYLDESNEKVIPDEGSNEEWALIQADAFSKGFAKKWVKIDVKTMPNSEIKLLVATACYLENNKHNM